MAILANNRQVNVWRGDNAPPTIHHVWIKDDVNLFLYDEAQSNWIEFLTFPGLKVESQGDGTSVTLMSGDSKIILRKIGASLSLSCVDNVITFTSTALTTIATSGPLKWDGQTLHHLPSGVVAGIYGARGDTTTSSITIPSITVDEYGHITDITDKSAAIPAVVEQIPITNIDEETYQLLLSSSSSETRETGSARKTIYLKYNVGTKTLSIDNIEIAQNANIGGNLVVGGIIKGTVEGNVQGTATPINHADPTNRFGEGTTEFYGHVKLQDDLALHQDKSEGIAASPKMVMDAIAQVNRRTDNLFSDDFTIGTDGKYYLAWNEI